MQDEVNTKVVAIMIKGGKISAEVLKKALDKFVQEIEKAQKQMQQPKTYRGKQSIKHLMSQNAAISNIEVTDGNIKSFERTASKYGLDFALKKDVSVEPPSYLVFFKGRDVDVMTAAFKEFSAKTVKQKEQPSIRHKLDQEKAQSKAQHMFFHRCGGRRPDLLSGEGASRLVYGGNADGGDHAPVHLLRALREGRSARRKVSVPHRTVHVHPGQGASLSHEQSLR